MAEISEQLSDWTVLAAQWERHLKASNKAAATRKKYLQSLSKFSIWASAAGVGPYEIGEDEMVAFIADQFDTLTRYGRPPAPESVAIDFRQLKVFFGWLCRREKLVHPMQHLRAPAVPEKPVPVLADDDLRRLLKAIPGDDFTARRDKAIIRMLFDGGLRRAECAGIHLDELNLDEQCVKVLGKGGRERMVAYGANTAEVLDDYLRARIKHRDRRLGALWLASPPNHRGALGYDGLYQMVTRVAARAGIAKVYPHRFRHTAAHTQLSAGMSEGDAMRVFGWRSRVMVDRYGSSAADARALEAARRISHADRI